MSSETAAAAEDLEEIREELRAVARAVLAKAGAAGPDRRALSAHGWSGLEVAEDLGGAGVTFAETAVVLEELGRAAAASGYLGTVLGVAALTASTGPRRDELLAAVAAGESSVAVALCGADAEYTTRFRLRPSGAGWILSGRAEFVPDAATADRLLVIAADPSDTPVVVCVAPATGLAAVPAPVVAPSTGVAVTAASAVEPTAGLVVTATPVVDESRTLGTVVAGDLSVTGDDLLWFSGDPLAAARGLHDRAALAVACDSLGVAEAMLTATVEYAKVREQFGRPIGSFQAVKHACADMFVQATVARKLVGVALDGDGTAVAMAKSYTGTAAVEVAGAAMQLHGGIGYTWESGIHRYLKRATLNRVLFGTPTAHRRRLSQRYR
ncbi:acyl-CoA dehydrogenase family protein [Nocardia sp. alder85J]|uniref:acyl-CoA dehydrogenase family protein n=1 Tax=Nocardia sp. alder85J TaxID=2862949 RepID=UPI00225B9DAD|nr:acyl-CoA dehydrogenase family protein [Nocardia sp. alder85J]MCX4096893.1 acyl-CoA/acyl-ACP dehydrogenase [Nocardia sp. alder85J]